MERNIHILLISTLLLLGIGQGGEIFLYPSPIGNFLLFERNIDQSITDWIDRLSSIILLVFPFLYLATKRKAFLISLGSVLFFIALCTLLRGSKRNYEIALFTQMARYIFPFALMLYFSKSERGESWGLSLFRLSLGSTFIFHGYEAYIGEPQFVDYTLYFFKTLMQEKDALLFLKVIGVIDIILGVLCFRIKNPWVFFYMAFWGLFTAFLRPYYHGLELGLLPMLLRAPHWGVPLLLAFKFYKLDTKNLKA